MIVFVFYTQNHWSKGKTFTEAFKNLRKAYGSRPPEIAIAIYEAVSFDEVYMTEFSEIHRGANDKLLYMSKEAETF